MDSSVSPRAAYTQHRDGLPTLGSTRLGVVFSASGKLHKNSNVAASSHANKRDVLSRLQRFQWYRTWHALRWTLAANVFGKPLPFLTAHLDLKLGDVLLTLPFATTLLVSCAVELVNLHTKKSAMPVQIAMALTFVLSVRNNSLLLALTGLSFDRAMFYHKLFGVLSFITASLHGMSYLIKHHEVYGSAGVGRTFTQAELDDAATGAAYTGSIAYFPLAVLFLLSFAVARRTFYEFFVRTHWVLFLLIILGSIIHRSEIILAGVAIWALDALYRLAYLKRVYKQGGLFASTTTTNDSDIATGHSRQRLGVAAPSQVSISRLASDLVCLQFPAVRADTGERFDYSAGRYVFLCIPQVSSLEWHPFSISSAPHEPVVTFHIKALGDWSAKVVALADTASASALATEAMTPPLEILIDGPYGNVALDLATPTTYSHVVLLSDGIGVTPMKSIASQLLFERKHHAQRRETLQRVHFVWSVRDRETLQAVSLAPFAAGTSSSETVFTTEIYLTATERDLEHPAMTDNAELERCVQYGTRPNVATILRAVGEDALQQQHQRVAVLACGPVALVKDVIKTSLALSNEMNVRFDVHTEQIEF